MASPDRYVPALRFRWLTPYFDRVIRLTMREEALKSRLIAQADVRTGHRVLDLGCGTGTLALMLKRACPGAAICGVDGDAEILQLARAKARAENLEVDFRECNADAPPFENGSFDRIVSTLVFHHLGRETKKRALASARRLLRPGGQLHIGDWGKPTNALMRVAAFGLQAFDGFETTTDNIRGRLPEFVREAGFERVEERRSESTVFGTFTFYAAVSP